MTALRVFSYGGGWQSTAALALAARGDLDFQIFLFANVGDDSEHPETITYVRDHAGPFAEAHGIELHVLDRVRRDGTVETLYGRLTKPGSRSLPIPVRMDNGAPGTRSCTADFKVKVIGKWLKAHGATAATPATVGIGISVDEIARVNKRRAEPYEKPTYPLLDLNPPIRRSDCPRIITAAGLPVPPKSACYFCPFHTRAGWRNLRQDRPDLFEKAADLEDLLNDRRRTLGRAPVWLTSHAIPLRQAVNDDPRLPDPDERDGQCDNGTCWT